MNSRLNQSVKKSLILISIILLIFLGFLITKDNADQNDVTKTDPRTFETSFESLDDFQNFYLVPQDYKGTSHELSEEVVHSGKQAHKAWVVEASQPSTIFENNNHRGYPTVQLYKLPGGAFQCPCNISFWVWVDANLQARKPENEWLSFATFTSDGTDDWSRTVLVNLSYDGFVHLMHVPNQGEAERDFQTQDIHFPMKQWVKITVFLDLDSKNGYAKVWQDDELVSQAKVRGGNRKLAQTHFGLYAAPSISNLVIYNDDLAIEEVQKE